MPMIGSDSSGGGDGEEDHDVRDRLLGHEAAEEEQAGERQRAGDEVEPRQEALVEAELVDHPPARAGAGAGQGAEGEDDDHRAEQGARGLGRELAQQAADHEADDGERAAKMISWRTRCPTARCRW
jgi:hypothetical protein